MELLHSDADLGKIGGIISGKVGRRRPIIPPATPCVWLKIAGHSPGDRRVITVAGRLGTADLYQTCLIIHRQLVSRRRVGVAVNHLVGMALKLEARSLRASHIDNFAFHRAHDQEYIRPIVRDLRARDTPLLYELFRRSAVYQYAVYWNNLPIEDRLMEHYEQFIACIPLDIA